MARCAMVPTKQQKHACVLLEESWVGCSPASPPGGMQPLWGEGSVWESASWAAGGQWVSAWAAAVGCGAQHGFAAWLVTPNAISVLSGAMATSCSRMAICCRRFLMAMLGAKIASWLNLPSNGLWAERSRWWLASSRHARFFLCPLFHNAFRRRLFPINKQNRPSLNTNSGSTR